MDVKAEILQYKTFFRNEKLPTNAKNAKKFRENVTKDMNELQRKEKKAPFLPSITTSHKRIKSRFIDINTGINLHYLEWPSTGASADVILLLHDVALAADHWNKVGTKLSHRGYRVISIDMRGHGDSSWASEGQYTADIMAKDIQAFILAKDLYTRPMAIAGHGIGAVVAITLAYTYPRLIGAVIAVEFGINPELTTSKHINCSDPLPSHQVMPWWSFWSCQDVAYGSVLRLALDCANGLTYIGPGWMRCQLLALRGSAGIDRDFDVALQEASLMVRPAMHPTKHLKLRMDTNFFFEFDVNAMVRGLSTLKSHMLVVYSENSTMTSADNAMALTSVAAKALSQHCVEIPDVGHCLVTDDSDGLYAEIARFLEGDAVHCFDVVGGKDARRPEVLGLRPLPEYATVEEAKKALGPRQMPTMESVEEALRELKMENGGGEDSDGDEEEENGKGKNRQTALAKDPPEYFGFVG